MKTFEEEYRVLLAWYLSETAWYAEQVDSKAGALDGEDNEKYQKQMLEYNRRLKELKAKYGKE